jgi:hypothetical protein
MRAQYALGAIAGAAIIELIVAACSSSRSGTAVAADDASSGPDFEVAAEVCDKTYTVTMPDPGADGGMRTDTIYYAEHAYPGKSKFEIAAHVRHWTIIKDPNAELRPTGYEITQQEAVYTRDGLVGAGCSQGETTYFIYH